VAGPIGRVAQAGVDRLAPRVMACAAEISRRLGWWPGEQPSAAGPAPIHAALAGR
jgi:hypothetical protein